MRSRVRPFVLGAVSCLAFLVGVAGWSPSSQADVTPPACTSVGPKLTDYSATLTLPKFDPALGTLQTVTLSGSADVTMRVRVENEGPVPYELGGDLHAIGELEADRPLLRVVEVVHHVDGEAVGVEHVRHAQVIDLERGGFERLGLDHEVALRLQDVVHVLDGGGGLGRRLHGEGVVVLVLVVAGLVRPQAGERLRHRGALQPGGADVLEIDGGGHGARSSDVVSTPIIIRAGGARRFSIRDLCRRPGVGGHRVGCRTGWGRAAPP